MESYPALEPDSKLWLRNRSYALGSSLVRDDIRGADLDKGTYLDSIKGMDYGDQRAQVQRDLAGLENPKVTIVIDADEEQFEALLQPVGTALLTFEKHLERILQRWTSTHNNARMEGLIGLFQAARPRARGYRNTATFITMIHLISAPLGILFISI